MPFCTNTVCCVFYVIIHLHRVPCIDFSHAAVNLAVGNHDENCESQDPIIVKIIRSWSNLDIIHQVLLVQCIYGNLNIKPLLTIKSCSVCCYVACYIHVLSSPNAVSFSSSLVNCLCLWKIDTGWHLETSALPCLNDNNNQQLQLSKALLKRTSAPYSQVLCSLFCHHQVIQ